MPFTVEQFFQVFARYNAAIWPGQLAAYALGLACVVAAWRGGRGPSLFVGCALGVSWAVVGGVYFLGFFRSVNPAATAFGVIFLVQALLFAWAGARGRLAFRTFDPAALLVGAVFLAYAMVLYPVVNLAGGHELASSPSFGVTPCPVTIFTFGMFLLARAAPPWLVIVPLLWSFLGLSAAIQLRVPGDYGLGAAGVIGTVVLLARSRRWWPRPAPR
jgi:Family of unknown function (DUF6064)